MPNHVTDCILLAITQLVKPLKPFIINLLTNNPHVFYCYRLLPRKLNSIWDYALW